MQECHSLAFSEHARYMNYANASRRESHRTSSNDSFHTSFLCSLHLPFHRLPLIWFSNSNCSTWHSLCIDGNLKLILVRNISEFPFSHARCATSLNRIKVTKAATERTRKCSKNRKSLERVSAWKSEIWHDLELLRHLLVWTALTSPFDTNGAESIEDHTWISLNKAYELINVMLAPFSAWILNAHKIHCCCCCTTETN